MMPLPIHLINWIETHRHHLRPPVCNKVIWEDEQLFVMVVGSPNKRKDFHVNGDSEFFYQLEGQLLLHTLIEGRRQIITVNAGEIYLLPANVPHCPVRPAGGVGMVIEHQRKPGQKDGFQWYCEQCNYLLYEEWLVVSDIEAQLSALMERFLASEVHRTCVQCGSVLSVK
ncbi:MAG: 3-hydroxyanthranilate 3,4-dioxygenase [Gammaproteobacteria bacterium]